MDDTITISRTSELPFDSVALLLRHDPGGALRPVGAVPAGSQPKVTVQVHPRWPWRTREEVVTPRIGPFEAVGVGKARLNLSWQATHHNQLPDIDGHLEISQVSATACEFRYVGECMSKGLYGKVHDAARGRRLIDDAVDQLLDTALGNLKQHLTTST